MGAFLIGENGAALERRAKKIQEIVPPRASTPTATLPDVLRREGWLVGSPQDIVGQIQGLAAEGIERFMLQFFDQEDLDALRLVAQEVLPRLASGAGRGR
jgi:alkanesulfonate monooxygenase SsuD/methylene tetrahydromethanopterin reductase-like flavin-dependent oxidoreductase (luciferase family)